MNAEQAIENVFIPLAAVLAGAFLAFRYQYSIEKIREKRAVLQNLVMYRNVGANELEWIKSVNAIDLVYHNNERVRQLFSIFYDIVCDDRRFNNSEHVPIYYEMLYEMAKDCGYSQLTAGEIKSKVYSPNALSVHYPNPYRETYLGPPSAGSAAILDELSQLGTS